MIAPLIPSTHDDLGQAVLLTMSSDRDGDPAAGQIVLLVIVWTLSHPYGLAPQITARPARRTLRKASEKV